MSIPRLRYTHWITIYDNTNCIFSGNVSSSMIPSSIQPTSLPFKLECTTDNTSDITGLIINGLYYGDSITENITLNENETIYTENQFTSITKLFSKSYDSGTTIIINSVDDAYQPVYYENEYGPYKCTFSTTDGMSAGIQPESVGLITVLSHYVRLPLGAPVSKTMEFEISPIGPLSTTQNPYDGIRYIPTSDFDVVCIPPRYIPVERAFRCSEKTEE